MTINGEERILGEDHTVLSLLDKIGLNPKAIVVEINGQILNRDSYASTQVQNEDRLELIRFMGGG